MGHDLLGKHIAVREDAHERLEARLEIDDGKFSLSTVTAGGGSVTTTTHEGVVTFEGSTARLSAGRCWTLVRRILEDDAVDDAESHAVFDATVVGSGVRITIDGVQWELHRLRPMNAAETPEGVLTSWIEQVPGYDAASLRVIHRVEDASGITACFIVTHWNDGGSLGHARVLTGEPLLRLQRAELCSLSPVKDSPPGATLEQAIERFACARRSDLLAEVRVRARVPFRERMLAVVDLRYEEEPWTNVALLVGEEAGEHRVMSEWESLSSR